MNEYLTACSSRQTKYFWTNYQQHLLPLNYALFGPIVVEIGQLLESDGVFEDSGKFLFGIHFAKNEKSVITFDPVRIE